MLRLLLLAMASLVSYLEYCLFLLDSARSQDTYKGTLTPERDTESAKEKDFHDDDNGNVNSISKDLSKNDELPAEAKSMLAELQMDPSGNFKACVIWSRANGFQ